MSRLDDFRKLTDAEDFFEFLELPYDEHLVEVKRLHIMRLFGQMLARGQEAFTGDDEKTMDFYRFALASVYGRFVAGESPSAADIWGMYERSGGCLACASSLSCGSGEMVAGSCGTPSFSEEATA